MPRQSTKYIVIHCAATRASMDVGVKEIRQWHTAPPPTGRGWSDIGYHYVIRRNGMIERGRAEDAIGAHVENHNSNSLGICMVGGLGDGKGWPPQDNFTAAQWETLKLLCGKMVAKYPGATILGHRDFPGVSKACPSFDARAWASRNGLPASPNLKGVQEGTRYGVASMLSGGVGEGAEKTGDTIRDNSEMVGQFVSGAQDQLSQAATVFDWAGYCLKGLAVAIALYSMFCLARMLWRWWKGERDYGVSEAPQSEAAELDEAEAPAAPRKKKRTASRKRRL